MRTELFWLPSAASVRLAIMPRPRGGDWLDDEMRSLAGEGVAVLVSCLTSWECAELELGDEEAAARRAGIEFLRFPMVDRGVPPHDAALENLVDTLAARVARGDGIAIHCRAGIGRASLVAACLLVSGGMSAGGAFELIGGARGVAVPDTEEQRSFVEAFGRARGD